MPLVGKPINRIATPSKAPTPKQLLKCKACNGTRRNSRGGECVPCRKRDEL